MYKGVNHLSQYITPQTCGIIWLTDENLNYKSPGIYEFNYLLDGLLVKALEKNPIPKKGSNYFLGENFGKTFFISHIVINSKEDFKTVDDHFKLSQPYTQENATVYIYNKSKNTANINVLKELTQKYKEIEFKNLNI